MKSLNCKSILPELFFLASVIASAGGIGAVSVKIESPKAGFTTERVQKIEGTVTDFDGNRATLVINGIPQTIPVYSGRFSLEAIVAPGSNLIEVKIGNIGDRVSFFARVPPRDVKIVLTWDTPTDVDLWVIDPKGEKCFYSHKTTASGGNLDMDITAGYGPETFTMEQALPGSYSVQVQYYSAGEAPVTRVRVFVILYEGTAEEKRLQYYFTMTREHTVYDIAHFEMEPR